ncbi:MAG: hypothetical protein AB7N53_18905 [Candidatus Binatia bacterium]
MAKASRTAVIMLSFLFAGFPALAATVSVPDVAISNSGNGSSLMVVIDDAAGLEGADLVIDYDPAALSVTDEPSVSTLTAECLMASNLAIPGVLRVSIACAEPLSGGGALISFPVQPQGNEIASVVGISRCNLNEEAIPCAVGHGSITIVLDTQPANRLPTPESPTVRATGSAT